MHCMAMLTYSCMEESCVRTVFDSATLLRTMLESTVELSKETKKEKQAPTVNSSIFTYIVSNESMVIYMWRKDLSPSERYEGEMECRKENTLGSQICPSTRGEKKTVQY